ncbi:hypothetical protein [uncultured Acetatifactor sp.]|uniref:hypothetical protein n=1 Tax=uncultured Acetatifactor sp. TaxID=1671927 RepID=UPI002631B912|nr:hypothetical protein [uncultured Acetatifactor sp.]
MSLERNIERIADAMEAVARMMGAQAPTERTGPAAPQAGQQMPAQPSMQQARQEGWQGQTPLQGSGQPAQMQQPQGGQVPVSLPGGMGAQWQGGTAQAGAPQAPPVSSAQPPMGAVPTTASAQQYTFDQLAVATANLASSGKDVFTILGRFGASMLMDLPKERYGEYAAALREAGAVV